MSTLLESVAKGWSWRIGNPVAIVATNRFGNAIVKTEDGLYHRIMPEDWACRAFAASDAELKVNMLDEAFRLDWEMENIVAKAEASLGPLASGRVYYLVTPSILGGSYFGTNIRTITLIELLSYSGEMARQMEGVPDGSKVKIVVKNMPNHVPDPTLSLGTPPARQEPRLR
jgi:hypothetical protein